VALLGVQPLVMTLGTGLMTSGIMIVYGQQMMASTPAFPRSSKRSARESSSDLSRSIFSCGSRLERSCSTD